MTYRRQTSEAQIVILPNAIHSWRHSLVVFGVNDHGQAGYFDEFPANYEDLLKQERVKERKTK